MQPVHFDADIGLLNQALRGVGLTASTAVVGILIAASKVDLSMVEDNVTNSAIQPAAGAESIELDAAEIQKALTELESSLMYSVAQLGPALEAIEEQLHKAAVKIREEGDAGILWNCLENLQHFLKLLETITVTAGISPTDIASFDNTLSSGLEQLEQRMNEASTGEDIAAGIEATLIPALKAWPECEAALFSVVEPRPFSI